MADTELFNCSATSSTSCALTAIVSLLNRFTSQNFGSGIYKKIPMSTKT
jgi:hypothetical protein